MGTCTGPSGCPTCPDRPWPPCVMHCSGGQGMGPGGCGQAGWGCQHLVPTPACVSEERADKHGALAWNWVRELPEGHGLYLWTGRGPPSRCSPCLASFLCPEHRAPQYDLDRDVRTLEWTSAARDGRDQRLSGRGPCPPPSPASLSQECSSTSPVSRPSPAQGSTLRLRQPFRD